VHEQIDDLAPRARLHALVHRLLAIEARVPAGRERQRNGSHRRETPTRAGQRTGGDVPSTSVGRSGRVTPNDQQSTSHDEAVAKFVVARLDPTPDRGELGILDRIAPDAPLNGFEDATMLSDTLIQLRGAQHSSSRNRSSLCVHGAITGVIRDTLAVTRQMRAGDEVMNEQIDTSSGSEGPDAALEDAQSELSQIRVYLLKEGIELPNGVLREQPEGDSTYQIYPINYAGLAGHLVLGSPAEHRPDWLPFIEEIHGKEIDYKGNRHISAVLLIERSGRAYALTFGFGRHLLDRDALEPDFGLRTAAGLIDPEAIASVDSRAFEATVLQVRRQSSRGTGTRAIGLDVGREMLRAIAGQLLDDSLGTRITGSDSLGLTAALSADALGPRLDLIGDAYGEKRYTKWFKYLDRWQRLRATDPVREALDDILLAGLIQRWEAVRQGADPAHMPAGAEGIVLTAPEIIEYNSSGFLTSLERNAVPHAFPDLDAYLMNLPREPRVVDLSRNHRLMLMAGEPFAIERDWPLYNALTMEFELRDEHYVLMDGAWWRVDGEFRTRIDERVTDIPLTTWLPGFDPIEDEPDFNERVVLDAPTSRGLIDRKTARYEDEEGGVEPCDVFTAEREFVHVKRLTGSDAMSHLFAQALVGARLYLSTKEYRDYLRRELAASPDVAVLIPTGRPVAGDHKITLAVITRDARPAAGDWTHIGLSLPFLARTFLFHVAGQIEELGYKLQMARVEVVPGIRPATLGHPMRFKEGVDPRPNRWANKPRRRGRRPRTPAAVATT